MNVLPASETRRDQCSATDSFRAIAVTGDSRGVLAALTGQAVAHFGRDHLMMSNVQVALSVSAPGSVSYLASGDFSIIS